QKRLLIIYWCSPIVFFINYIHGQLDIIPTALFFSAVYLLITKRYLLFVLLLAVSAACKTHILLALPFLWVFMYKRKFGILRMTLYFLIFTAAYVLLIMPYLFSEAFRQMVFNSPEQKKVFDFVLSVSPSLKIYICPTAIAMVFLKFVSYKKLNREILLMFLGIVFAAMVVLVPPMPGWFMWSLPFLVYFYMSNRDYSRAPFILYNVVYLVYFLFFFERKSVLEKVMPSFPFESISFSVVMASVGFIAFWMFHLGIRKNEELKVSDAPVLIGIGGDSGSGKHTLLRILRLFAGKARSISISGDDFHKWERGSENWQVYTHLNPSANRLHRHMDLAVALKDGREVETVQYDHKTGKFSDLRTIEPQKFIFFVGLHPFYLKKMRDLMTMKIFLEPEEKLRHLWKIKRDVIRRGYDPVQVEEQIKEREKDRQKYIQPQRELADLIIRYQALVDWTSHEQLPGDVPLKTTYVLDNSINLEDLVTHLSNVSTLTVEHFDTVHSQELAVQGSITREQVLHVAYQLGFNFDELSVHMRKLLADQKGITQLVFLVLYNHKMKAGK
ncbi:MAG: hypothetical protein PHS88_03275, partial [Candidatus Omnitrophica bacterium]|nr:hypothetical protein [Candidatus Omnitrophota bacterium]